MVAWSFRPSSFVQNRHQVAGALDAEAGAVLDAPGTEAGDPHRLTGELEYVRHPVRIAQVAVERLYPCPGRQQLGCKLVCLDLLHSHAVFEQRLGSLRRCDLLGRLRRRFEREAPSFHY